MLKFGSQKEFEDPSLENCRLCAELLGTFFLVLAADGGIPPRQGNKSACRRRSSRPELMVIAIILFMGGVSGADLNSAVSLRSPCGSDFLWKRVPVTSRF